MPHTNSAKKRLRQSERRRLYNRAVLRDIKIQLKKVKSLAVGDNAEQLATECRIAVKKLDKAAGRRVVHAHLAARKKSQIARLLQSKTAVKS
jgi:small subunit ribosomal protein S20